MSETGVSEVHELKLPGEEFMQAVSHWSPVDGLLAFNAPHTIAYAIYLDDLTPFYNVRWDEFQLDPFSNYQGVGTGDRVAMYRAWINEIKHSVDFQESSQRRQVRPAPRRVR